LTLFALPLLLIGYGKSVLLELHTYISIKYCRQRLQLEITIAWKPDSSNQDMEKQTLKSEYCHLTLAILLFGCKRWGDKSRSIPIGNFLPLRLKKLEAFPTIAQKFIHNVITVATLGSTN
jgi:hypothetical protein